ncbi:FliH/SctL family protein [Caballeronia sp. LZ001]|uniref:FliH/SctL family protein n=1 Tax=Caballeronia sp. LZ001 TaxID=3038553 RepID=UPI002861B2DB|nr:FliH/SctL family protein [Caballeronia sp. LZ001]MDR5801977.1 FliH/SctL family protein [Caballeronia sp. LZ001]
MLIWRVSDWRVESDGYICANDLALLQDLPALQRVNAQRARQEAADLAQRARRVRRQALARGFIAGRAAAVHDLAMPAAAAAFALRGLNDRLVKIVVEAVRDVVGDMPAGAIFPNQLRRSLQAAPGQRPLSVRVSACDYEEARQAVSAMEDELGLTLITVLGDADLPPRSCVVETDIGVIDGSLRQQLAALERGIRDAIAAVLDEYTRLDDRLLRQFDVIEQGLRDTLDVLSRDAAPAGWIAFNATSGGAAI